MTLYVDAETLRKVPFRTVFIEVEVELLAETLGRRFTGPDGDVLSMEQVDVRWDDELGVFTAMPVIVNVSAKKALCDCGDCPYCRQ